MEFIGLFLISALRSSVPVALAAVGGTFSARCGIMPMGMEGFILMGAFGATCGSYFPIIPGSDCSAASCSRRSMPCSTVFCVCSTTWTRSSAASA